jgi:hypothetical protein
LEESAHYSDELELKWLVLGKFGGFGIGYVKMDYAGRTRSLFLKKWTMLLKSGLSYPKNLLISLDPNPLLKNCQFN